MLPRLKPNDSPPAFVGIDRTGEKIELQKFIGRKPIWLIFYRYAGCILCNLHFSALLKKKELLENRGLQIIVFYESPKESLPKDFRGIPYPKDVPVVCDPEAWIYKAYGVDTDLSALMAPSVATTFVKAVFSGARQGKLEGELGRVPAHFFITESGRVDTVYYGKNVADHIPFTAVTEFIERREKRMEEKRKAKAAKAGGSESLVTQNSQGTSATSSTASKTVQRSGVVELELELELELEDDE